MNAKVELGRQPWFTKTSILLIITVNSINRFLTRARTSLGQFGTVGILEHKSYTPIYARKQLIRFPSSAPSFVPQDQQMAEVD
jgi:hypothetical protein